MTEPAKARKNPCASCPFRTDVASGLWDESEYSKLPRYDLPIAEQPVAVFKCHSTPQSICSGWLGMGEPSDLLAVRVGLIEGRVDESVLSYTTDAELHPSGAAAADHGRRDIGAPSSEAHDARLKIIRLRDKIGFPIENAGDLVNDAPTLDSEYP